MSRAFMKESEPEEPRCPSCSSLGEAVGATTIEVHVAAADRAALGDRAYYCSNPSCRLAYFNGWGTSILADQILSPAWPKDPKAPICPCFGVRADDIEADARAGRKERVKHLLEQSKGPDARCAQRAPDGQCCMPKVYRLFKETFEAGSPRPSAPG